MKERAGKHTFSVPSSRRLKEHESMMTPELLEDVECIINTCA
jgi:hypothetical protein